ncbi:hypothetical protein STCU_06179 [Strigomonas culicis]|uniref:Uncharacterized protein n=1 Tax=Strigomonas culicis TaxID=28005 RepID=S9UD10_9TRYP|nr:hypothetical protein STCU_06179 [Strigomonas culicis]|eukprot:EPY26589.1 hypothetical protein STCU_06179 [Strigomonas culicis]
MYAMHSRPIEATTEVLTLTLVPLSLGVHPVPGAAATASAREVDVTLHVAERLLAAPGPDSGAALPYWAAGDGPDGGAAALPVLQDVTNHTRSKGGRKGAPPPQEAPPPPPLATLALPPPVEADPALLGRLHYAVGSYSTELELKRALAHCLDARAHHAFATAAAGGGSPVAQQLRPAARAHMVAADGTRYSYVLPVEAGRYLLAVGVPPALWGPLGPALVALLLRTAVTGYAVPPAVAASAARPAYVPLHTRLQESPAAVERAMRQALQPLAAWHRRVRGCLTAPGDSSSPHTATAAAADARELYIALVRLCRERVSLLRVNETVALLLERLVREATAADDLGSLRGPLAAHGMADGQCRYVCGAAALWYRGHPVYSSLAAAPSEAASYVYEQQLLPAAASTMLEAAARHPTYLARGVASSTVLQTCTAMAAAPGRRAAIGGYQQRTRPAADAATLVVSAASARGWTVAVALTRSAAPYVGTPLPVLAGGLEHLLLQRLDSRELFAALDANSAARYRVARPAALRHTVSARLLEGLTHLRVLQRRAGQVCRDRCLFALPPAAPLGAAGGEDRCREDVALGLTAEVPWGRPHDAKVEQLLFACARLGGGKYRLAARQCGGAAARALAPAHTVTSVLQGAQQQRVLFYGTCVPGHRGLVHYVVAEVDVRALGSKEDTVPLAALPQEYLSLSMWFLSKTL